MTPERESELYANHPRLLIYRPWQGENLPMQFGIQCGDGWHFLIDRLLHRVQVHADVEGLQPVVLQIKEKLGGLRVYWRDADLFVLGINAFAEDLSESICEVCGLPGSLVTNSYGARWTRCELHRGITYPDELDRPQHPEQRPRTRRRVNAIGAAPMPSAADLPDQVLVDAALLLAIELGRLSISMLQVKLKIGYARAERLRDAVLAIASSASSSPSPR